MREKKGLFSVDSQWWAPSGQKMDESLSGGEKSWRKDFFLVTRFVKIKSTKKNLLNPLSKDM